MSRLHTLAFPFVVTALLVAITGASGDAMGQAAGAIQVVLPQAEPEFGVGKGVGSARQQAQDFLRARNLDIGFDKVNARFVALGVASFKLPREGDSRDRRSGIDSVRQEAYLTALLNAKRDIARFLGAQVSAIIERRVKNGSAGQLAPAEPADAKVVNPSTLAKLDQLLQAELDGRIADAGQKGKPPEDAASRDAAAREASQKQAAAKEAERRRELAQKLVLDQDFSAAVNLFCRAEIGGLQPYRTFESVTPGGDGQVAVVLITDETSREMMMALLGRGPAPRDIPRTSIASWAREIGDEALLYTHGAHMRANDSGEIVLVAFGQATPLFDEPELEDAAASEAETNAYLAARLFVGDLLDSESDRQGGSRVKVYSDRSRDAEETKLVIDRIRASAEALTIPGGQKRYAWSRKHPRSGATTHGYVMEFSVSSAESANALRKMMDEAAPSKGGAGITSMPAATSPAGGSATGSGSTGAGAEGGLFNKSSSRGGAGAPGRF